MIERQTINGRPVLVSYLDADFNPVAKNTASMVKLTFDEDGEVLFLSTGVTSLPMRKRRGPPITPHNEAIRDFAHAMDAAEKPRAILKKRFGYNDRQIGSLALAYSRRRKGR